MLCRRQHELSDNRAVSGAAMPIARVRSPRPVAAGAKKPGSPTRTVAKKTVARKSPVARSTAAATPSARIDARIAELGDWRGEMLARLRALIHDADPEIVEEWKWRGVPVW